MKTAMVYDTELKRPACVLIQAAFGCGANPPGLRHFEPRDWLTHPTPGMRVLEGTDAEWRKAAEITKRARAILPPAKVAA